MGITRSDVEDVLGSTEDQGKPTSQITRELGQLKEEPVGRGEVYRHLIILIATGSAGYTEDPDEQGPVRKYYKLTARSEAPEEKVQGEIGDIGGLS